MLAHLPEFLNFQLFGKTIILVVNKPLFGGVFWPLNSGSELGYTRRSRACWGTYIYINNNNHNNNIHSNDYIKENNIEPILHFKFAGCVACTDVTGFGLIGHLLEMCSTSQVEAATGALRLRLPGFGLRQKTKRNLTCSVAPFFPSFLVQAPNRVPLFFSQGH